MAVIPEDNSVARIINDSEAGVVVAPGDRARLLETLERLSGDSAGRALMGKNARRYAEETFDVEHVATEFEAILEAARRRS